MGLIANSRTLRPLAKLMGITTVGRGLPDVEADIAEVVRASNQRRLSRFALNGSLTDTRSGAASFTRSSIAFTEYGAQVAANTPRYDTVSIVENEPDAIYHGKEDTTGAAAVIPLHATSTGRLWGAYGGTPQYSDDGCTWTAAAGVTNNPALIHVTSAGSVILVKDSSPYTVFRSTDNGATWGSAVLSLQANALVIPDTSLYESGGTLILAEYSSTVGFRPKMYRSVDDGATWAEVYYAPAAADAGVNQHIHCVIKHAALGVWYAVCGDGSNRMWLYSTDDGVTWVILGTNRNTWLLQPVKLYDYGDATKLLAGSDETASVYSITFGATTKQITATDILYTDRVGYYWGLAYHDGVYYATSADYTGADRQHVVLVSTDLRHWATYLRLTGGSEKVEHICAHPVGGRMHIYVSADGTSKHLSIALAKVRTAKALVVDRPATNQQNDTANSSFETGTSRPFALAGTPTITYDTDVGWSGTRSAKCVKAAANYTMASGGVAFVENDVLRGSIRIKSDSAGEYVRVALVGATSGTVYSSVTVNVGTEWQEVMIPAWTGTAAADAADPTVQISVLVYYAGAQPASIWIDGFAIYKNEVAATWQVGGTARTQETYNVPFASPATWTHTCIVQPLLHSAQYTGTADYQIRTFRADADNYATVFWSPDDAKFGIKRVVAGVAQTEALTDATKFHRHAQLKVAVTSDGSNLNLTVICEGQVLTASDSAFTTLNSAMLTIKSGDAAGANVMPMRVVEDKFFDGVRTLSEIRHIASDVLSSVV